VIADPEDVGESFDLSQIIDVSAGSRRPQYQSVQVIGNTATAERGLDARHLISSQPILAEAGEGQPSFIFEDDSIATQQQAVNVAESLLRKLKKQQQGGFVTVVGRPDVRPFDLVTLPPAQGGQTFLVASVEHTITDTDGFVTRLSLGGSIR
jgi:Phage late control gene D protein (GPD).